MKQPRWKLEELADKSVSFLEVEGDSNRVQWKPNGRQIRYYTTLGLLGKPFGGRGQGATYGPKHLLQLIAIKRLQHQGLKLAEIQEVLNGLSQERLLELLGFSQEWIEELAQADDEQTPERSESDFWSAIPPAPVRTVKIQECSHFDLGPGATFVADNSQLSHLDPDQQQQLANDLRVVWQRYRD